MYRQIASRWNQRRGRQHDARNDAAFAETEQKNVIASGGISAVPKAGARSNLSAKETGFICRQIASRWNQRRGRQQGARNDAVSAETKYKNVIARGRISSGPMAAIRSNLSVKETGIICRQIASRGSRRRGIKHGARNDGRCAEKGFDRSILYE